MTSVNQKHFDNGAFDRPSHLQCKYNPFHPLRGISLKVFSEGAANILSRVIRKLPKISTMRSQPKNIRFHSQLAPERWPTIGVTTMIAMQLLIGFCKSDSQQQLSKIKGEHHVCSTEVTMGKYAQRNTHSAGLQWKPTVPNIRNERCITLMRRATRWSCHLNVLI